MSINWTTSGKDLDLIVEIVDRALTLADELNIVCSRLDMMMDIQACHCNGTPLKLAEFLEAENGDFAHDVFGIRRHLNRETGQLMDCFVPRYAERQGGAS